MLKLFTGIDPIQDTVSMDVDWLNIKPIMESNVFKIRSYYLEGIKYLPNSHFLARLMDHVRLPDSYLPESILDIASMQVSETARLLGVGSNYTRASVGKGYLYQGTKEIYFLDDSYVNPYSLPNWKEIPSVEFIYHSKTSLKGFLPLGQADGDHDDFIVLKVHTGLLNLQWKYFLEEFKNSDVGTSVNHFLIRVILPGLLPSYFDGVFCNRLFHLDRDIRLLKDSGGTPFPTNIPEERVDKLLLRTIKKIKNSPMPYRQMLKHIPAWKENSYLGLQLPQMFLTRQNHWLVYLTRINHMKLLITIGGTRAKSRNLTLLGQLKREIEVLTKGNHFSQVTDLTIRNYLINISKEVYSLI